jgi:hypothetical protein
MVWADGLLLEIRRGEVVSAKGVSDRGPESRASPDSASRITLSSEKSVAPVKEARTRAMIHMGGFSFNGVESRVCQ